MTAMAFAAAIGSALIVVHSSLFAPLRDWLFRRKDRKVSGFFWRLTGCPMCAGFWTAVVWTIAAGERRPIAILLLGPVGSLGSALMVALWQAITEAAQLAVTRSWAIQQREARKTAKARKAMGKLRKAFPHSVEIPGSDKG
jgi:hypothetical protein